MKKAKNVYSRYLHTSGRPEIEIKCPNHLGSLQKKKCQFFSLFLEMQIQNCFKTKSLEGKISCKI